MNNNFEKILKQEIENYEEKYKATISVLLTDFEQKKQFQYGISGMVDSASVIKMGILVAVLEKVKTNDITLDTWIDFSDYQLENYSGIYVEQEKKATLSELLTFMIINSDNMATNVVIDLFGFDYYNHYFQSEGYKDTSLERHMGMYSLNKENYTSNQDMLKLLDNLYHHSVLNDELCNIAISILSKQRAKNISQRYIYEDIEVYHKTGGLAYLNLKNDCGYFILNNKPYYFGIFVSGGGTKEIASIFGGKIFKYYYHYLLDKNK